MRESGSKYCLSQRNVPFLRNLKIRFNGRGQTKQKARKHCGIDDNTHHTVSPAEPDTNVPFLLLRTGNFSSSCTLCGCYEIERMIEVACHHVVKSPSDIVWERRQNFDLEITGENEKNWRKHQKLKKENTIEIEKDGIRKLTEKIIAYFSPSSLYTYTIMEKS